MASTLTNLTVRSEKMGKGIPVSIVLPESYERGRTNYPCVYMLHGAGGSNARVDNPVVRGLADRYGLILVAPDGGRQGWWLDSPVKPDSQYETFVVGELLPYVDARFRTQNVRAKRGIMGGSMGGHGACYLGFRHKDLFGVVGSIYGGVDLMPWSGRWGLDECLGPRNEHPERWREHSVVQVAKTLKNGEIDLICTVGTEDFFLGCNRMLHDLLSANGVAHTYVEVTAPTLVQSSHGRFYNQGAELCLRFIANYFTDGHGHLGDVK